MGCCCHVVHPLEYQTPDQSSHYHAVALQDVERIDQVQWEVSYALIMQN